MAKRIIIILLGMLLVVGVLAGIKFLQIRKMIDAGKMKAPPPAIVTTAKVQTETWQSSLTAVGSLSAVQGVTVAAELAGKVVEITFKPGTAVEKGDLLLRFDAASEQAQLSSAETAVALAKINRDRARELVTKKSMPRSGLDTTDAQYKQAVASANEIRAVLDKKTIRAPFSGRLGIRLVNLGQILSQGDGIVDLQSLNPIFVDFSLPQQDLSRLNEGLAVQVTTDVLPEEVLDGKITAINPGVDPKHVTSGFRQRWLIPLKNFGPVCLSKWLWCCRKGIVFLLFRQHQYCMRPMVIRFLWWTLLQMKRVVNQGWSFGNRW